MSAVVVAATGLLLYVWEQKAGLVVVVVAGIVALVLAGLAVASGQVLADDTPRLTRWLLAAWSPGVVLVVASVAAAVADASTHLVAPDGASDATKTTSALATAALVAVGSQAGSWLPGHLSPWLARRLLTARYAPAFPCLPAAMPAGEAAYRALQDAAAGGPDGWCGTRLVELLRVVHAAHVAYQTAASPAWHCAP
jgi:hypothetical protein